MLDVAELDYIDDAGMQLLLELRHRAASDGVRLLLACPTGQVLLRLNAYDLSGDFVRSATRQDALRLAGPNSA